jgi:hypothetical protein
VKATPHMMRRDSKEFFLCCGVDLLLNAVYGPLSGQTQCPVCGRGINVVLDGESVLSLTRPGTLVVACELVNEDGGKCIACSGSALLDSPDCVDAWIQDQPGSSTVVYSVRDYALRCCAPGFLRSADPRSDRAVGRLSSAEF